MEKTVLSPFAAPFFPNGTPGRSKAMRWSSDLDYSDYSDSEEDEPKPPRPSYSDVLRRGTPASGVLEAGTSAQPQPRVVEEPSTEAQAEDRHRPPRRKRGKRKRWRGPHRVAAPADSPTEMHRASAKQRLGERVASPVRAPAKQRLGEHVAGPRQGRVPAKLRLGRHAVIQDRLGARAPTAGHRRISPPDTEGWWEVLPHHSPDRINSPPAMADRRPPRRPRQIPEAMRDKCLNCLSRNHRIATCRRLLRCLRCLGYHHYARDCKRPRKPAGDASGTAAPAPNRFVRARHASSSGDTAVGSQAEASTPDETPDVTPMGSQAGETLGPNQATGAVHGPEPMECDPLPPGLPKERQWESTCILQCNPTIDAAEAGLRYAITAMSVDATREMSAASATRALQTIAGVEEGSFTITPFYPEQFLIQCRSLETRNILLGATPIPVPGPG